MKWICIIASVLPTAASAAPAQAAAISECPAPPGAVNVVLPSGLPPALRRAMGNIALPGERLTSTDVYVEGHKYGGYPSYGSGTVVRIISGKRSFRLLPDKK
jgi:hypothetical protein